MAPSLKLRQTIDGHIRDRPARGGHIYGSATESERLVSNVHTNSVLQIPRKRSPEISRPVTWSPSTDPANGLASSRAAGVDYRIIDVLLDYRQCGKIAWKPREIGEWKGGTRIARSKRTSSSRTVAPAPFSRKLRASASRRSKALGTCRVRSPSKQWILPRRPGEIGELTRQVADCGRNAALKMVRARPGRYRNPPSRNRRRRSTNEVGDAWTLDCDCMGERWHTS